MVSPVKAAVLDKEALLRAETFWDNHDWDWYKATIPFFECPDPEITTSYYYRWELITKHLTYGSPDSGYSYTEFIDRPFWSGAYGAISCPAGHQFYDIRWFRDPRLSRDYARYWLRTPGAQPRRYSTWLADSVWAVHQAHPNEAFIKDLLPDLIQNYEAWEKSHFIREVGLFWQNGHDDGMEFNINSRQSKDIFRGSPGYRPTLNSYLWADAQAIARIADLAGDKETAEKYRAKADGLKTNLQKLLWDPKREFFFHMFMRDEEREGHKVQAMTLTHQTGQFAGSPHGRELIGYIPWQFNLPDRGYEAAWKFLMDPGYFFAPFGPRTVEANDPMFFLSKSCCWWSGMSWPYASTQTLKALANLLQNYPQEIVSKDDYLKLLQIYSRTHRKNGKPYIAEAAHPETGSWDGHDGYNHSEHYFHSGYTDLIITGLVGLKPRSDGSIEVHPLAPESWDYFALDELPCAGHRISILWDKNGSRYGRGAGLTVLANGNKIASSPRLGPLTAKLPPANVPEKTPAPINHAINNDGYFYPRFTASHSHPRSPVSFLNDGNYWYHLHPPNRWTSAGSPNATDWLELDLGAPRNVNTVKLYFLDDGETVVTPASYQLEYWTGTDWKEIPDQKRHPSAPAGRRANAISFAPIEVQKIRAVFTHGERGRTGLTEFEAWGEGSLPYTPAPPPPGNIALNLSGKDFPKASASFSDRYGGQPRSAIDGKVIYRPTPMNRWTSYGSTNATDWLEVDFGTTQEFRRIDLLIYDDRGGVQPPESYTVQYWADGEWREAAAQKKSPETPIGSDVNTVRFEKVTAPKVRVLFTHKGKARSGVTELMVWNE
jgi:hypothetical protein